MKLAQYFIGVLAIMVSGVYGYTSGHFSSVFTRSKHQRLDVISFHHDHPTRKLHMAPLISESVSPEISAKSVTKEIMAFFGQATGAAFSDKSKDASLASRLMDPAVKVHVDGMHIITLLFQTARARRRVKTLVPLPFMLEKLKSWDREWSERDISTFIYGIRALECVDPVEGEMLKLAAKKITESTAVLTSRAIGNALYGLQEITSDNMGVTELCQALATKLDQFQSNLNGQDIGIGLYGIQGMSSSKKEVRALVGVLAQKIAQSEVEFDAQALSNSLYGLQSLSSDHPEVLQLVSSLATKAAESRPMLSAQAIGSALFGLQNLDSEPLEVRSLVATLAEKIETSTEPWDAQAIASGLFGLQKMKSNIPEVRALLQAIAKKVANLDESVQLSSQDIGSAIYGLHNFNSDEPQVRTLIAALANRVAVSKCSLSGQGIADSLYGLQGMTFDCIELRALLSALGDKIDDSKGKLESQEIGNALYGLQSMTSEMKEIRVIVNKIAEKIKRSRAYLRSQHIARALLGLQKFSADSSEVRNLLKQLTKRIGDADRTILTASAISDSLYGIQGLSSRVPEVQELLGELAKKISSSDAILTPEATGRALFGLQGLSSGASLFEESAIGIDSDEVQFLLSALWDKMKASRAASSWTDMSMASIGQGLMGVILLKDPIANNIKQFLYLETSRTGKAIADKSSIQPLDLVSVLKGLKLNNLPVPRWIEDCYKEILTKNAVQPIVALSRPDKIITSKYITLRPNDSKVEFNTFVDGFRVDLLFKDINLIVELDGPTHQYPSRRRYDKERDNFITVRRGYKVVRMPTFGQSFDDVVKKIDELVISTRDKQSEQEIQRMYASETAIQSQYRKP